MFIDGKLSLDYDLQGERQGGTDRGRNRAGGQEASAEPARNKPRAEAKATCLAIEDRARSPVYSGERLRGAPKPGQPRVICRRVEWEREDSEEVKQSLTEAEER